MAALQRVAVTVAMYRAERTGARPPQIRRLPRRVPLSQLNGHTPTKALMPWRFSVPSSGRLAIRVRVLTGPMPGTLFKRSSFSRHTALADALAQLAVYPGESALQPFHGGFQVTFHARVPREGQAVSLRRQHLQELTAASHQRFQLLEVRALEHTDLGFDHLRELRDYPRIDAVGLGQNAQCPGKVTHLPGIDDHHRQAGRRQRRHHALLIPPLASITTVPSSRLPSHALKAMSPASSRGNCRAVSSGNKYTSSTALDTSIPTYCVMGLLPTL